MTKRVQNPWSFFKIERPSFWTSFLLVSSIKGMPAAMLWSHCVHALLRVTKFWEELCRNCCLDLSHYGWDRALLFWNHARQFWVRGENDVHESQRRTEREIHSSVYVSVVQDGKGNKRKNAARRSRKPYLNFRSIILLSSADVNYFDTGKLKNSHRLGGKKNVIWFISYFVVACVAGSNGSEMPGCDTTC